MNPEVAERLEILRRICERGLARSVPMGYDAGDAGAVDLFQHMLNELALLEKALIPRDQKF